MCGSSELFLHSSEKYRIASPSLSVSPAASPHSVLPSLIFSVSVVYYTRALCVCLSSALGALHPAMTMK